MLAIAGGKGGCGKTTTTIGLATVLEAAGYRPLVVDADTDMPNVHHLAEIDTIGGIDAVASGDTLETASQSSPAFPGVRFLTAGGRNALSRALDRLRSWSGPVLIDCPTGVDASGTRPLGVADSVLLVSTDQPQCLEDTRTTGTLARNLGSTPCGVLVWKTAMESGPRTVGPDPVLETVPTVDPFSFDEPRLRESWRSLARQIYTHTHGRDSVTRHESSY